MGDENKVPGHIFLSYVRDDTETVDRLRRVLEAAGVRVWRDTNSLWPGQNWRTEIRRAITDDALIFIACFSRNSTARDKSYQNEELMLAIEQLRERQHLDSWLIPVRLDDCLIPDNDIGGGRTLTSIQRVDVFGDSADEGIARLVATVLRLLGRRAEAASMPLAGHRDLMSPDSEIHPYLITDSQSEENYYSELASRIRNAKEEIYCLGWGFSHERRSAFYDELIDAERHALRHGVNLVRIQAGGGPVAKSWADGYADLLEQFPGQFKMVADLNGVAFNTIGIFDPHGHDPIVHFLFETRASGFQGLAGRPVVAVLIKNAHTLANALSTQIIERAEECVELTPGNIRDLGRTFVYFGWGVHMATRKMLRDVPDAKSLGIAALHGWQRDISGMLAGPANRATIQHANTGGQSLEGVAYELSWWGKTRLDKLERRAYQEIPVEIDLDGKTVSAFTYIPLPPASTNIHLTPGSWIDLVVEGALENNMTGLIAELQSVGVAIETLRRGTL